MFPWSQCECVLSKMILVIKAFDNAQLLRYDLVLWNENKVSILIPARSVATLIFEGKVNTQDTQNYILGEATNER